MGLNPLVQRVFKGLFDRNKTSFVSPFHVRRCSSHRRPVREDGSGSVSTQKTRQDVVSFFAHALHNLRTIPANIPMVNMTGSSMAVLMLNFNLKSFSTRMEGGRRCVCMRPCQSIIIRQIGFLRSACLVSASASGSASSRSLRLSLLVLLPKYLRQYPSNCVGPLAKIFFG